MTNGLTSAQIKWLTYLVYFLLAVLTLITGWNTVETRKNTDRFTGLPKEYVRLERYNRDQDRLYESLNLMNRKLDRLIERDHD